MVYAVGVGGEGLNKGALLGIPDFDSAIERGGVDFGSSAPFNACDAIFVTGEDDIGSNIDGVPDSDCGVFGC